MANNYTTIAQLFAFHDRRQMLGLSGDANNRDGEPANIQTLLDASASRIDSYLTNRVALPLTVVPAMLTEMTADFTADRLYQRRESRPKGLDAAVQRHMKWLEEFQKGTVQLPGVDRTQVPRLRSSDYTDGRSRFDRLYGFSPSDTGPSRGQ